MFKVYLWIDFFIYMYIILQTSSLLPNLACPRPLLQPLIVLQINLLPAQTERVDGHTERH